MANVNDRALISQVDTERPGDHPETPGGLFVEFESRKKGGTRVTLRGVYVGNYVHSPRSRKWWEDPERPDGKVDRYRMSPQLARALQCGIATHKTEEDMREAIESRARELYEQKTRGSAQVDFDDEDEEDES